MPIPKVYDFSGWATKNDLECSDGRTIRRDAFKDCDGTTVSLVWKHNTDSPDNILGHALLENRPEGVYAYGIFNDTEKGLISKKLVDHKDIQFLSIYANQLVERSKNVIHGAIREVSLVVAGANPGARIDNWAMAHSDGSETVLEDDASITTGLTIELPVKEIVAEVVHSEPEVVKTKAVEEVVKVESPAELVHADSSKDTSKPADKTSEKTIEEIFNTFNDEQKNAVYAIVASIIDAEAEEEATEPTGETPATMKQSDEGDQVMKKNVFDGKEEVVTGGQLTHAQFEEIVADAKRSGSLKESFLKHTVTYGFDNVDYLFPDAKLVDNNPAMITRKMEWVAGVINGTNHTPFAKVKSVCANITADEARARGYVKGTMKKNEIIALLTRTTTPKTIYKKQQLDRDDLIDITDLDIVAWMKAEMRVMLDEEIARAILVGDGRDPSSEDKINEANLRPIWTDSDVYAHHVRVEADAETEEVIDEIIRAREYYHGSGSPTLYTSTGFVSDMLLIKDTIGRRIYPTMAELLAVLRVKEIVEIPVFAGLNRESDDNPAVHLDLVGIIVNLKDYTIGANKGGQVSLFEDFDIDYNLLKYLLETRISGALTMPKSALVIEQVGAAG